MDDIFFNLKTGIFIKKYIFSVCNRSPRERSRSHVRCSPSHASHMMNIVHFKLKKVKKVKLFLIEFKNCSIIHHIQQENFIENQ